MDISSVSPFAVQPTPAPANAGNVAATFSVPDDTNQQTPDANAASAANAPDNSSPDTTPDADASAAPQAQIYSAVASVSTSTIRGANLDLIT